MPIKSKMKNFDIEKAFADFQKNKKIYFAKTRPLEPILTEKVKTANIISAKKTKKQLTSFSD